MLTASNTFAQLEPSHSENVFVIWRSCADTTACTVEVLTEPSLFELNLINQIKDEMFTFTFVTIDMNWSFWLK